MHNVKRTPGGRKQKGAAAIEFAAVFVIFFGVFYALVSYSLPLLMMQSFNAATSEAVRRSVALSPTINNYSSLIVSQAQGVLTQQLDWMPATLAQDVKQFTYVTYTAGVLKASIAYPKENLHQILPVLSLPVIGEIPRLPTYLSAEASLQLVP
ncbi:TadE/TadG family type IV pilus assembly protein [Pseudomonas syringae]|uniref:Pilus assembly protein TadE n=1 Tax=Pseudomonas syringae TaxID=317 RepID=A0A085V8Z4_PSESX|nr:TadE/TadG family type IV pilus assembly protein [Pseudomonas syringae]KFE51907.1 pilus assembly protein TadE [Pseudomonas syringae]